MEKLKALIFIQKHLLGNFTKTEKFQKYYFNKCYIAWTGGAGEKSMEEWIFNFLISLIYSIIYLFMNMFYPPL